MTAPAEVIREALDKLPGSADGWFENALAALSELTAERDAAVESSRDDAVILERVCEERDQLTAERDRLAAELEECRRDLKREARAKARVLVSPPPQEDKS